MGDPKQEAGPRKQSAGWRLTYEAPRHHSIAKHPNPFLWHLSFVLDVFYLSSFPNLIRFVKELDHGRRRQDSFKTLRGATATTSHKTGHTVLRLVFWTVHLDMGCVNCVELALSYHHSSVSGVVSFWIKQDDHRLCLCFCLCEKAMTTMSLAIRSRSRVALSRAAVYTPGVLE